MNRITYELTCPHCGSDENLGEFCNQCGRHLSENGSVARLTRSYKLPRLMFNIKKRPRELSVSHDRRVVYLFE